MIVLTTGLPGGGKTLLTIARVKALAEKENRPVYYHGIRDLALPWIELENPEKWYEVEPNAIVVLDEAQRVFRPRGPSQPVPKHVEMLETHRHLGIDLWIITQQPGLLDKNVRQLVGQHFHVVRKFGMQRAVVHEWAECKENTKTRKDSVRHDMAYPKEAYSWYKSAEVHTHKRRIPMWYWLMFIMPVVALGLGGYGVMRLMKVGKSEQDPVAATATHSEARPAEQPGQRGKTPAEWISDQAPRVPDLAYTAPIYDEVTKPTVAPYPAACVRMRGECRCYTQQGTRLDVSVEFCGQVVERGYFVAWSQPAPQSQGLQPAQGERPKGAAAELVAAPVQVADAGRSGRIAAETYIQFASPAPAKAVR